MLHVQGGTARLAALAAAPVVAILGSRVASDYGTQMARSLARGLAASGVTVAASLTDGIAVAAHAGALDAGGGSVAVLGGGLRASCPPRRRALYERADARRLRRLRAAARLRGTPLGTAGERTDPRGTRRAWRSWWRPTRAPGELAAAHHARALGRTVAAIPGRVTSPLSRGTTALLMDGASLVRGARDVLDLLYAPDATQPCDQQSGTVGAAAQNDLRPDLRSGPRARRRRLRHAGPRSTRAGMALSAALLALSELELRGLLVRGDGGRYLPRKSSVALKSQLSIGNEPF